MNDFLTSELKWLNYVVFPHGNHQLQWFGERVCVDIIVTRSVYLPSYVHHFGGTQQEQLKHAEPEAVGKQDSAVTHTELSDFELAKKLAEEWQLEDEPSVKFAKPKSLPAMEMAAASSISVRSVASSEFPPTAVTTAATTPPAAERDRWARELALLAEMGFTDRVVPLLERHLRDNDDQIAGLQLVITLLLSRP